MLTETLKNIKFYIILFKNLISDKTFFKETDKEALV